MRSNTKFRFKLWGWRADKMTMSYPLPRIIWNLAWFLPLQITRFMFCACVMAANGTRFKRVWEDSY